MYHILGIQAHINDAISSSRVTTNTLQYNPLMPSEFITLVLHRGAGQAVGSGGRASGGE